MVPRMHTVTNTQRKILSITMATYFQSSSTCEQGRGHNSNNMRDKGKEKCERCQMKTERCRERSEISEERSTVTEKQGHSESPRKEKHKARA